MKSAHLHLTVLLLVFCTSCGGPNTTDLPTGNTKATSNILPLTIDAEQGVLLQNSLPKGGPYTSPTGERFGHVVFWTRVVNKTATPLEIAVNFPADSFAIFSNPDAYLKLFLPPGEMTLDKIPLRNYGLTSFESFIAAGLNTPTSLRKTIPANGEHLFYVGMLYKSPDNNPVRAGFVLKGQDLFYRIITAKPADSTFIPSGHILFKKGNPWSI